MPFTIERNDVKLTSTEVLYWKRMFKSNIKIGVEIESNYNTRNGNNDIIQRLRGVLYPTNDYRRFGKFGVNQIKGDGSLQNGVELTTVGRRLDFLDLYYQYRFICRHLFQYDPIINDRCGLHNHVLFDYCDNVNSLEKTVPDIIMKNFIQLVKKNFPELVYLTSTCKGSDVITRRENFCIGSTLMARTPLTRSVSDFFSPFISETRYNAINAMPMGYSNGKINRFHFELRFPDGSVYPAQIASQNILYGAMLLKAIELSEFGVINTGTSQEWEETKRLYTAIRDRGEGRSDRHANPPSRADLELIKQRTFVFLKDIKSCIEQYDTHTYHMLKYLAENPISILRRSHTDQQINNMLDSMVTTMYVNEDNLFEDIKQNIITGAFTGMANQKQWCQQMCAKTGKAEKAVEQALFKLSTNNKVEFDIELGTVVLK